MSTAFWLLAFWSVVIVAWRGRNPFYALGIALIAIAVGVALTRFLLGAHLGVWYMISRFSGFILAGILCFVIGSRYKKGGKDEAPSGTEETPEARMQPDQSSE